MAPGSTGVAATLIDPVLVVPQHSMPSNGAGMTGNRVSALPSRSTLRTWRRHKGGVPLTPVSRDSRCRSDIRPLAIRARRSEICLPTVGLRSYPVFSHTETWAVLSPVKGLRFQSLQRSSKVIPASRAIRSSSDGHT